MPLTFKADPAEQLFAVPEHTACSIGVYQSPSRILEIWLLSQELEVPLEYKGSECIET